MLDVRTSAEAIAALRESVLPALQAALNEHRDAIDPLLDGTTARVLDLVGADLVAETQRLELNRLCGVEPTEFDAAAPKSGRKMGRRQTWAASARGGGQRRSRLYAHHSNGLR